MSLLEILSAIFIGPLKLIFEIIFSIAYSILNNPGLTVVVLSLAMNILVLPLYKRADAIQIEARDTENKLRDVVAHIKKTFSGDERMMILQTYYRQNNYSPLSVLSGSVSLLLEIPFFMAAYQFLSHLSVFAGVSFGPIRDLSLPDRLICIGSYTFNALPILMTVINVVSSSLYLKGFPLKTKIQLYGMALVFLILLYNSPAALVFYWTLNNTFSLLKTLYYRIKDSHKILCGIMAAAGIYLIFAAFGIPSSWRRNLVIILGVLCQLPWAMPLLKKKLTVSAKELVPNKTLFILGGLFLTVLVGLLVPSNYIVPSPQEYMDLSYFYNPVWYIVKNLCLSVGLFLVWFGVFYWLANPKGKVIFTRVVWILSGIMLVNYMFFGEKLGIVSSDLTYETGVAFAWIEHLINAVVILALAAGLYFISVKFPKKLTAVLLVGVIALSTMGIINTVRVAYSASETKTQLENADGKLPEFSLSKNGQNVVVIMLDRGIGPFVPYIMEENPTLQEQFDGFTYYSNTLSYGAFTNFATPALYGGYDYTPVEMNKRDQELLKDKHNEALKVVPTLLSEEGYDVTVIDPSYAGYKWIPDLSIYDDMQGVTAYIADGRFNDRESRIQRVAERNRNFFLFSLMRTMPVCIQSVLYDDGNYLAIQPATSEDITEGVKPAFINAYNVMKNMETMTRVTNGGENTYMFLRSNMTHEHVILQEPYYTPSNQVDNHAFYTEDGKVISANGQTYLLDTEYKIAHYQVNMAALMQLGNWFDYLRQEGVYDNTRIIIVSDHGRDLAVFDDPTNYMYDLEFYTPMLLVKDFGDTGFQVDNTFMTNADVPALTLDGLIENPVNPFTGNPIDTSGKEGDQYVILSEDWDVAKNNGTQFMESAWAVVVSGDVWNKDNWTIYEDPAIFPPGQDEDS